MLLADCGTAYVKILDTDTNHIRIVRTTDFLEEPPGRFDAATGHLGRMTADFYQNELICLARGAQELLDSDTFCVIDVGGRDTKLVEFKDGKPVKLDWNTSCGANTGFTLEIVGKYYDIDFKTLLPDEQFINVTCGVFGIERVFDLIIDGFSQERAVARFVHGVARNVHRAVDRKEKFYLSGGLVENTCFLKTLERYADVHALGRTVLLEGLKVCTR
ncbi:MAG: BadF/BadG/BcrA/BcrD ATPase family protein [bacterium]